MIEGKCTNRVLSSNELDLLQRDPYRMFKNLDSIDYINVSADDIKFEGDFRITIPLNSSPKPRENRKQ